MNLPKFLSPTLLVVAEQAVFSGTNFLITLFLAKQLSTEDFGLFSSVILITFLVISIANAVVIQPFQVHISKIESKVSYYYFLTLCQIGIVGLLFLISRVFFSFHFSMFNTYQNAISIFVVGYVMQDFVRKLLLATNKIYLTILIDLLFIIMLFIGFDQKISLETTLKVIGFANLISIVAIVFSIKKFSTKNWNQYIKIHLSEGKWLLYVSVLQWLSSNFFVLVSGYYIGIGALGVLRLMQTIFGVLNIILQSIENYILPKVSAMYNTSEKDALQFLRKNTFYCLSFFVVFFIINIFFADKILVLIGGTKYLAYKNILFLMTLLYFFIFLSYPFRIMIRVLLENKSFFYGYLISFLLSLATFHFLLHFFQLNGAVIGLILNQLVMILLWKKTLQKYQIKLF